MSKPLFILAPPRSFTSVICAMIGNHPEMVGLAETNLFAAGTYEELSRIYRVRPRFQHGLLRTVAELGLGGQTEENVEAARAWLAEHRSLSTAQIFEDLASWAAPREIIDKSPMHCYSPGSFERMERAFPQARYLHLLRHPRPTCESIYKTRQNAGRRFSESPRQIDLTPEAMWLKPHRRILEFLEGVPEERRMTLRGELVLSEPQRYLKVIAEWLSMRTDQEALDAMLHPEASPFARYGPGNAPLGNDPNFLSHPRLRPYVDKPYELEGWLPWDPSVTFSEDLKSCARRLGYP